MNEALFFIFTYIYVYEHRKRLVFIKRTRERLKHVRFTIVAKHYD